MEKKSSIIIGRLAERREERAQPSTETNEHARMSRATTTIVAKPGRSKAWGIIQARKKRKREEHQDRVERERLLETKKLYCKRQVRYTNIIYTIAKTQTNVNA